MKKKLFAVVISVCLAALSLTSCGNEVKSSEDVSYAEQTTTTTTSETTTTTESAKEATGSLETSPTTTTTTTTTSETTTTTTAEPTTTTTTTQKPAATTKATAATTKATTKANPNATMPTAATTKAPTASSPNVTYYQNKLVVAGDSIAYGFCAYGYIPYEHNIAQGSLAMRNYTSYGMFNTTGKSMRCMDTIAAVKPELLYVSMGMNDVNITNAQTYANNYVGFLKQVRAKVPNCIIVAANITPIAATSNFTNINNIRNCNAAMQAAVKAMNDPYIVLFDAYSIVSGGGTYMVPSYSAGDGIHLAGSVYPQILSRLAVVLDQYSVRDRIIAYEKSL